jgi:molybdopterin synthase catalytic subunit
VTSRVTPVTSDEALVRLVDLSASPLDVAEVLAAVEDATAGGLNLFIGRVRNHDHGQTVDHLEYTAHPSARERLHEVAREVAAEFDVVAVAAVHRTGSLVVGDIAVVVAVSAAHRGEAYDASRALIDRLKQRVPVWKHQVFADGADEWVNAL